MIDLIINKLYLNNKFILTFLIITTTPCSAIGGSTEEAKEALIRSHNNYYTAITSKSKLTKEEKKEIIAKIITPAQTEYPSARREDTEKFATQYVKFLPREEFDKAISNLEREEETLKDDDSSPNSFMVYWKKISTMFKDDKNPDRKPTKEELIAPKIVDIKDGTQYEEMILDSKDIAPKELVFAPTKKAPITKTTKR
ncbi:MAG: hypothetical protein HY843_06130 [Bdellovibrio sp.]|nr:hypothetical protein [Bdellovibrio sp.]